MTASAGIRFTPPRSTCEGAYHHDEAAAQNVAATRQALLALMQALDGTASFDKVLLRAAAGAGKSFALIHMVQEVLQHHRCARIAITAFANKQVYPLAGALGKAMGSDAVCLFVAAARLAEVPDDVRNSTTVVTTTTAIPNDAAVILGTSHKLGVFGERRRMLAHLGPAANGEAPFDVLMVDEAWQLPLHRYATVERLAPISIGVGDVGQLPPIDPAQNPWRGDSGYNPYRAWPTEYADAASTFVRDLPAVWRPTAAQLPLWRAFYSGGDWDELDCVAAPEDRDILLPSLSGDAAAVWSSVATGVPTLVEFDGLADTEAADVDQPLLQAVETVLAPLLEHGFAVQSQRYDSSGRPTGVRLVHSQAPSGDPLVVVLATRNQAVDDAADMVERLTDRYSLPAGVIQASTVDSWQGQTNAVTIAVHPLSGASKLDDFNSAFGRLAVTCTRATHGLLLVARAGLDDLLATAPARQGTPFGEPGPRSLPRQTHQRILETFARARINVPHLLAGASEDSDRSGR